MAVGDWKIIEWPSGTYHFAGNGRWKAITGAHYFTLASDNVVTLVTCTSSAEYAAYTDALGTPGPL